jgi:hypothetical protein
MLTDKKRRKTMKTKNALCRLMLGLLFLAAGVFGTQPLGAAALLATTGNGFSGPSTLLEIDPVTGATLQTIGPVGYIVNGLEFDPATGKLYGSTSVNDPNYNGLIEIDMTTGAGTPVGVPQWGGIPTAPINCVPSAVTNITIDVGGQMYGWLDPCDDDLVRIDKTTGIATWVGASGVGTARNGLDFDNAGTLYMVNAGGQIYMVNTSTGAATLTGSIGTTAHHGDFDPLSNLYNGISTTFGPRLLVVADLSTTSVVGTVPLVDEIHVLTFVNQPPDCTGAFADPDELWPPNHKFVDVNVLGVTDPDGDPVTITIDSIFQDEPLQTVGEGNTCPDGAGVGDEVASVRAERSGSKKVPGDGRVYHIEFTADDGMGGACDGGVTVCVPHDQRPGHVCVDGGLLFDSTDASDCQ